MNLLDGELANGVFSANAVRIPGLPAGLSGPVTLGFRAEDASLTQTGGEIEAPAYSVELLGESSMVTVHAGGGLVSIKTSKEYRAEIGSTVRVSISPARCHLFDRVSGKRLVV